MESPLSGFCRGGRLFPTSEASRVVHAPSGKVENGIKYVRGNFWPGLHFSDLEDLNAQALHWLNTVANCRVHGTTNEVPFARLPKEGLQPLDRAASYDTSFIMTRRASRDCVISYASNLYSVPAAYAQQSLQIKVTEQEELIICSALGKADCSSPVEASASGAQSGPTALSGACGSGTACGSRPSRGLSSPVFRGVSCSLLGSPTG